MRGKTKKDYIGRYTVAEFHQAKSAMLARFGEELTVGKLDKILKYCAEKNWPEERSDTYHFSSLQGDGIVDALKYYDHAQDCLDEAHHGGNFIRVWPVYEGIPESKREVNKEKVRAALRSAASASVGVSAPGYIVLGATLPELIRMLEE